MPSFKRISSRSPLTFRYLRYRLSSGRIILLPLIHVELESETERLTTIGLLDSGATLTFIPFEIADILGVIPDKPKFQNVTTAGGIVPFFKVRIKRLSLLSGGKIFSDFRNLMVLVPSRERDLPYVILGRDTVFKRFHTTFKENIKKFVIKHHKSVRK